MRIIIDTPIWSYALRSNKADFKLFVKELEQLIHNQQVIILIPIRQEILSGYSDLEKFEELNNKLAPFDNTQILDVDYIQAARFSNICRSKGIQASHIDFLICSVSFRI